jgi:hypothetical protein
MSEWITDRRPSWEDDLVSGLVFVSLPEVNRVIIKSAVDVVLGEPWQRILTPEPYVKPKRWTLKYNGVNDYWELVDGPKNLPLYYLNTDDVYGAAERIRDIYNEVIP